MDFGERLKALREEKELTRAALASRLIVSYSAVSKYETNVRFPDKETLINLADVFEVSIDYLLCRTNIKETAEKIQSDSKKQLSVNAPKNTYTIDEDLSPEAILEIEKFKEFVHHKYSKKI